MISIEEKHIPKYRNAYAQNCTWELELTGRCRHLPDVTTTWEFV